MVGNPVLGFLQAQPVGDDARVKTTRMLRMLGIVVLAGFVLSILNGVLLIAMGADYGGGTGAALGTAAAVTGIVIALVITGLVCWWITYTIGAWSSGNPSGATHALILGILATIFGGLGVLGTIGGVGGATLFGADINVLYSVINTLSLLVAAGELVCGILILVNRGKAMAPTGNATPTRN